MTSSRSPLLLIRHLLVLPITLYQKLISPLLPSACIYQPTCSSYARDAVLQHGLVPGGILALARVSRCVGALFFGGEDPVPSRFSFREIVAAYRRFCNRRRS